MAVPFDASGQEAAGVVLNARCVAGGVPGIVAGKRVCLKVGQRCAPRHEARYRRYGFTCHRRRLGRLFASQLGRSVYTSLSDDRLITARTAVLSAQIVLPKSDHAFLEADGGVATAGYAAAAAAYSAVDGSTDRQ